MLCNCGRFYVGKTIRALWQRIKDHIYFIKNGKMTSPISLHVALYHNFDPLCITFFALEHIPKGSRGGDWDKKNLAAGDEMDFLVASNGTTRIK